jgi:hypothetical protein
LAETCRWAHSTLCDIQEAVRCPAQALPDCN